MNGYSRTVVWFNRFVLTVATFVMAMIALRNLRDPIGATMPLDIALKSPSAVTIVRVGFGGFPLGFAVALFACLLATRRLLTGMFLMLSVVGAATIARIQGLMVDGATSYNLHLLRPELLMLTLSVAGIVLELRRRRGNHRLGQAGQSVTASTRHERPDRFMPNSYLADDYDYAGSSGSERGGPA